MSSKTSSLCPVALPVVWQAPPAALVRGSRQGLCWELDREVGPGTGGFGAVNPERQSSDAGIERGRRAPPKPGTEARIGQCPAGRAHRAERHRLIPEADSPHSGPPRGAERRSDTASQ